MGDTLMSDWEIDLVSLLDRHISGNLKLKEAAKKAGLSIRQIIRKKNAYLAYGKIGLISNKRNNTSNRAYSKELRDKVINLLKEERCIGFGPTFANEIVAKELSVRISTETLRQWMIKDKIWDSGSRHEKRVHQRRERREQFGELIQLDGSCDPWFEGRGPKCTLLLAIDDATSRLTAGRFEKSETTLGYFRLLESHIKKYGRPEALYSDKYCVFKVNQKGAIENVTQFTRAMKELNIEVICANSPQAKGRIERSFRTHQDRLIKLMSLEGISNIDDANKFLESYIIEHNKQYSIQPKNSNDAHEPLKPTHELKKILATQETRKISKNLEISFDNEIIQIEEFKGASSLIGRRCLVIVTMEKEMIIEQNGKTLKWKRYNECQQPKVMSIKEIQEYRTEKSVTQRSNIKNHPWRKWQKKIVKRSKI
jgi:DNA-binding transcriptional MerR regulator